MICNTHSLVPQLGINLAQVICVTRLIVWHSGQPAVEVVVIVAVVVV